MLKPPGLFPNSAASPFKSLFYWKGVIAGGRRGAAGLSEIIFILILLDINTTNYGGDDEEEPQG
jgi:hypothetical protein